MAEEGPMDDWQVPGMRLAILKTKIDLVGKACAPPGSSGFPVQFTKGTGCSERYFASVC